MPEMVEKIRRALSAIIELFIMLIAVFVLIQILFGPNTAFLTSNVVGNIIDLVRQLGDGGLVGLIAIGVILWLFQRRSA